MRSLAAFFLSALALTACTRKQETPKDAAHAPQAAAQSRLTDDDDGGPAGDCEFAPPDSAPDIAAAISSSPGGYAPPTASAGLRLADEKLPDWLDDALKAGLAYLKTLKQCQCEYTEITCRDGGNAQCDRQKCAVTVRKETCDIYGWKTGMKFLTKDSLLEMTDNPATELPKLPKDTKYGEAQVLVNAICAPLHELGHACQADKYSCKREGDSFKISSMCAAMVYKEQCVKGGSGPELSAEACMAIMITADLNLQSQSLMECHCDRSKKTDLKTLCADCLLACEANVDRRAGLDPTLKAFFKKSCAGDNDAYCNKNGHHPPLE